MQKVRLYNGFDILKEGGNESMQKVTFDYADVRAEMIRKGLKMYELSNKTGIGLTTLTQKMKHGVPFSGDQILALASILDIAPENFGHYFFKLKV